MGRVSKFTHRSRVDAVRNMLQGYGHNDVRRMIPKQAGRSPPTNRMMNAWRRELKSSSDKVKIGRPIVFDDHYEQAMLRALRSEKYQQSTAEVTQKINEAVDMPISVSLVYKKLKSHPDALLAAPIKKRLLTNIERKNRLRWVKFHNGTDWNNVYFTDEKGLYPDAGKHPRGWVWRERGAPFIPITKSKKNRKVKMVMFICGSGDNHLHITTDTPNGALYARLVHAWIPDDTRIVHDNERFHKCPIVRTVLEEKNIRDLNLPTYSPDCNPVEHAWRKLNKEIFRHNKVQFH